MRDTIPDRKTCRIAAELHNPIGFVADQANKNFQLRNGETALFWHLVSVVREHVVDDDPAAEGGE